MTPKAWHLALFLFATPGVGCFSDDTVYLCDCVLTISDDAGVVDQSTLDSSEFESEDAFDTYIEETCPDLCAAVELEGGQSSDCETTCWGE